MECASCGECFERKASGYKRIGINTRFKGGPSASETLQKHFSVSITPGKAAFICSSCSLTIRSLDVNRTRLVEVEEKFRKVRRPGSYLATKLPTTPQHRGNTKRQRVVSTKIQSNTSPKNRVHTESKPDNKITLTVNNSAIGKAVQLISKARYKNGLRQLFGNSKAAKTFATDVFTDIIRKEMNNFSTEVGRRNEGGLQSIMEFSWDNIVKDAEKFCPTMLELLKGSITKKHQHKLCAKKRRNKTISLIPIIGCLLMIIGYTRTSKCNIIQQLISVMMWLGGCKRKVFGSLNRIGICQSSDSTRRRLDNIKQDYDLKVNQWRDNLTKKEAEVEGEQNTLSDEDLVDLEDVWEDEEEFVVDETDEGTDPDTEISQSDTTPEPSTSSNGDCPTPSIRSTSTSNSEDTEITATSLQTEVAPIYDVNRQYYFDITFDNVNQKIGVRHHVRGKKNTMLNMVQGYATLERIGSYGLSNEIPTAADIRQILLGELLPSPEDEGELMEELKVMITRIITRHIPAFADLPTEWTIEHQFSKQSTQRSEIVPLGILNKDESSTAGMIEILEEYKKYVPEFDTGEPMPIICFCDGLSCERMDGAQRARINGADKWARLNMFEPAVQEWHRRLMFVQDTYDELFKFESHREKGTLYNLKQVFDFKAVNKNIMECFDKADELLDFATEGFIILATMEILKMKSIADDPENLPDSIEDKVIMRDNVAREIVKDVFEAPNSREVLNVSVEEKHDSTLLCLCHRDVGGTMVYCCNQLCERGSWFHLECLGMEEDEVPDGDWFCSEECTAIHATAGRGKKKKRTIERFSDGKNDYVRHLVWRGLNNIARHDAVKENDGVRMIRHWRFDMFDFFERNHPKYLIFGFRLLANIAGATSERIKHSLIWERTVNVSGGRRKNIPKDLHCEHLNREYKINSRTAGGQLTEETVKRYSQMLGIGKQIAKIFDEQVVGKPTPTRKHGGVDRKKDIQFMVKMLHPQKLFSRHIGRAGFKGFTDFHIHKGVTQPKKFKVRLSKHLENMAVQREMLMQLE